MNRTEAEWIEAYKEKGALWIHDGKDSRPHALLTSGKHSSGFFNSKPVIADENLLREAVADLTELLVHEIGERLNLIDTVVGPQTGATKLAELLADALWDWAGDDSGPFLWASPAKNGDGAEKSMVFQPDHKRRVQLGFRVLLCEDVITTGQSTELAEKAVNKLGATATSFVLALVNRSGRTHLGTKKIVALITQKMPIWDPAECELCKMGSQAIRPKEPAENWVRLNASYS